MSNRAFHPELWDEAERDRYFLGRLKAWAADWRAEREWLLEWKRRDPWSLRQFFRDSIRAMVIERRFRLYRPRYKHCHCGCLAIPERFVDEIGYVHWPRNLEPEVTDEEASAWVAEDPFERAGVSLGLSKALMFISRFMSKSQARHPSPTEVSHE